MAEELSYWDLLEPNWDRLGSYSSADDFLQIVSVFPRPIIHLYAAHFCQSEVCNGGLLQFLWNSTGIMAPEAIKGYHAIGMPLLAQVLEEAVSKFGGNYPREREKRWDALLEASPLNGEQLEVIFSKAKSYYLGFREATLPLGLDSLDKQFWKLLQEETGGFDNAATAYALATEPSLFCPVPSPNPTLLE
jgi:hypothetical protein